MGGYFFFLSAYTPSRTLRLSIIVSPYSGFKTPFFLKLSYYYIPHRLTQYEVKANKRLAMIKKKTLHRFITSMPKDTLPPRQHKGVCTTAFHFFLPSPTPPPGIKKPPIKNNGSPLFPSPGVREIGHPACYGSR